MANENLIIPILAFGGLITNYSCFSHCAHCIYRCSPTRPNDYISGPDAVEYFTHIKSLGCQSLHIGGGESLKNVDSLRTILTTAQQLGVIIEYVRTNASWFTTEEEATEILHSLAQNGLHALLVYISPFHNESIPYYKTQGVIRAASKAGVHVIPWVEQLQGDLECFDSQTTHSLEEYKHVFGEDYIAQLPRRYWVHFCGRALATYRPLLPTISLKEILIHSRGSCKRELTNTNHFHVDLYGNYIPGLCVGISIRLQDLPGPLDPARYPLVFLLAEKGINGLYEFAVQHYGFQPSRKEYLGKCDLCDEIRTFLARRHSYRELQPVEFYAASSA